MNKYIYISAHVKNPKISPYTLTLIKPITFPIMAYSLEPIEPQKELSATDLSAAIDSIFHDGLALLRETKDGTIKKSPELKKQFVEFMLDYYKE